MWDLIKLHDVKSAVLVVTWRCRALQKHLSNAVGMVAEGNNPTLDLGQEIIIYLILGALRIARTPRTVHVLAQGAVIAYNFLNFDLCWLYGRGTRANKHLPRLCALKAIFFLEPGHEYALKSITK